MWINSRERLPEKDGEYMYQSVYGDIGSINYTVEGGWNTHRSPTNGRLCDNNAMENDGYVARWFEAPEPEPIPEEWFDEYQEGRSNES